MNLHSAQEIGPRLFETRPAGSEDIAVVGVEEAKMQ
jgi:hypothetical protein